MNMLLTTRRAAVSFFVGTLLWCGVPWQAASQVAGPERGVESKDGQPLQKRVAIRFLTDSDYPPFNYFDEDNVLTGFNVDVARAICSFQPRTWMSHAAASSRHMARATSTLKPVRTLSSSK